MKGDARENCIGGPAACLVFIVTNDAVGLGYRGAGEEASQVDAEAVV